MAKRKAKKKAKKSKKNENSTYYLGIFAVIAIVAIVLMVTGGFDFDLVDDDNGNVANTAEPVAAADETADLAGEAIRTYTTRTATAPKPCYSSATLKGCLNSTTLQTTTCVNGQWIKNTTNCHTPCKYGNCQ